MISPPPFNAPPAVGVKANVAATGVLPATRSTSDTVKELKVTISPMGPLATEATPTVFASCDVVTLTPLDTLAVAPPIVKPVSVTVTLEEAAIAPVATVTAVELAPDVAALKVTPCDAAEIGPPETKKPDG